MKRSEMIRYLGDYLPEHITLVGFHGDRYQAAKYLLDKIEEYMPPPETFGKCSDPVLYLKIDNPDAGFTIPTHYIAGWDDE